MFKKSKKEIIWIVIFLAIAFVIVFAPSLIMNVWARRMLGDDMDKPIGNQSLWIHIFLTTNTGAAFSSGASNPKLVRTLQFLISFATLIVIYFVSKNRLYLFCFSVLSIGGFFNFFDGVINGAVMDYFQFNKYSPVGSAIFNVPDMCVVGSTILFLLIFITTMIRQIALGPENKIDTQLPLNLFLDTTQKVCYLCLFQNNKVIKKEKITTNNNLTDLIVEHINRMLKNCNVKKESIKKIYLTVGPGSFTGTRVGVLIAKTWATINPVELFVISANLLQTTNKNTISILDARSSKYYTCTYNDKVVKENITLKSMQEIQKLADKNKHEIVKDYDGVDIFNNLFQHINNFKKVNVDDLKPLYIKPAV